MTGSTLKAPSSPAWTMRNGSGKRCPRQCWECFDDRIEARAMAMDLSIKNENDIENHSSYKELP